MNKTDRNRPRPVSRLTASLLGYRTVAEVPFKIKANGWPVHDRKEASK